MRRINFLLFLLLTNLLFGQKLQLIEQTLNVSSPEVAALVRYADFPDLDFVGKVDVSIPLYSIAFGDINIPIVLEYNTKGNKVSDIATNVGLGWQLVAGGNITQKVNDQDDFIDSYNYYSDSNYEPEQAYAWHRLSKGFHTLQEDATPYSSLLNNRIWWADDINIDAAQDFYYVAAPDFKDKFFLTKSSAPLTYSTLTDVPFVAKFYSNLDSKLLKPKLDFSPVSSYGMYSGMNLNIVGSGSVNSSGSGSISYTIGKFELVKNNGTIYKFEQVEGVNMTKEPKRVDEIYSVYNDVTWHLTSMFNPINSKQVTFEYENFTNNYENLNLRSLGDINFGGYPMSELHTGSAASDNNYYFGGSILYNSLDINVIGNSKRIKKITFDQGTIQFHYGQSRVDYPGDALTTIEIRDLHGKTIKFYRFSYSYFSSMNCSDDYQCKRLKLESITDSESGTYNFTYGNEYISTNFPSRNSSKTDFLGYFNNNSSNIIFSKSSFHPFENYFPNTALYFYPHLSKDQLLPFPLQNHTAFSITTGIDRTPNASGLLGLLTAIQFPTSGSLEIDYENDEFYYEGINYMLGSARVKSLSYFDKNSKIAKKVNYDYLKTDGTSSGQINFFTTPNRIIKSEIQSGIGFDNAGVIGYSRITEQIEGKSTIEKKYTSFFDYPDAIMNLSDISFTPAINNFIKVFKFPPSYLQDYDQKRGKLIELNEFRVNESTPIRSKKFSYEYVLVDSLEVNKTVSRYTNHSIQGPSFKATNHLLRYFGNLKSENLIELLSAASLQINKTYTYNNRNLLKEVESYNTKTSKRLVEKYFYPLDMGITKFIPPNIYDLRVKVELFKNSNLISSSQYKYEASHFLPTKLLKLNIENNDLDTYLQLEQYDVSTGNLQQYRNNEGIPFSIVWGYNKTRPIALVEGMTYSQLLTALGVTDINNSAIVQKSNLDLDDPTELALIEALDDFRKRPALSNSVVTTFTHNPLIGISTRTPPSGIRETFKYDEMNKLQKVLNTNVNLQKEFKYKFSNKAPVITYQNTTISQVFKRNNCSSNSIGQDYNYVVPSGKYTSVISQTDADAMAQNDLNTNGQNTANIYGTCISFYCPLSFASPFSGSGGVNSSNNNYNLSFSFNTSSSSTSKPWPAGVKVLTINSTCRPTQDYNGYNGQVYYTIKTTGEVLLRTNTGYYFPNNTTLTYNLYYPAN
ncbi:DUF5977 domain-containing protein [Chryseobacterium sp. A321]